MTKPSFEPAKGTRDWYGSDTILRNRIRTTLGNVFERYGYDRLETPMIERLDALAFKGGGEIQKEVFRLTDQGGRDLALRFDQTVPLARYIASVQDIKFPFKRYAIGEVFRDGPTQPDQGRYRIFTQCDVDVLGVAEMSAEAELFALAQDAFRELGLGGVDVNINNRKLLDGLLDYAGVVPESRLRAIVTLDKFDKIGRTGVEKELAELRSFESPQGIPDSSLSEVINAYRADPRNFMNNAEVKRVITGSVGLDGLADLSSKLADVRIDVAEGAGIIANYKFSGASIITPESVEKILAISEAVGGNEEVFARIEKVVSSVRGKEGLAEVRKLLDYSKTMGFDFIKLNPLLARGLNYYTGTTLEVYLQDRTLCQSAILAGGRFDNMVGEFRGNGEEIPAVGFSFGLERLAMVLGAKENIPKTVRQLYVVPIKNTTDRCLKVCHDLRNQGINVDMPLSPIKVGKAVTYAVEQGIPFVGFIGEDELEKGTIRIKNLETATQEDVLISEVGKKLRNND